jgi:hypothetical protein
MPFPPDPRAILAKRHVLAKVSFLPKSITPYYTPRVLPAAPARFLTTTQVMGFPRKNAQNREDMNTESAEYSQSGSDPGAAMEEDAFDPSKTKPEDEKASGGQNLEVSPGNSEVSKQRDMQEGGAEESGKDDSQKRGTGFGSPKKGGDGESARKI